MANMDTALFFSLNKFAGQSSVGDWIIVFFADKLAYILVLAFLLALLVSKQPRIQKMRVFLAATAAIVISRGIFAQSIYYFYHRPRPFQALSGVHQLLTETAYSFPSGHATFFFALSTAIYLYNRRLGLVFLALSLTMGLARVVSGVHYPFDIMGGAILGTASGALTHFLAERFASKKVTMNR